MSSTSGMIDPAIFEDLQTKVDEDTAVRDVSAQIAAKRSARDSVLTTRQELKDIIQALEKQSTRGANCM